MQESILEQAATDGEENKVIEPYYSDNGIVIYNADCRDVLPQLEHVDLILTDPPYGVDLGKKRNNQRFDRQTYLQGTDTADVVIPLVNEVIQICLQRAKRTVMTPGVKNMFAYPQPSHVGSFYYPAASGCNSWGFSCWQPIYFYGKDPYGGKGSQPDSYMATLAAVKNGHPCPKPTDQWKWLLKRCSLPGEIVCDPFLGSGTTLVAALALQVKAIGIEIEEKYCEIAAKRMAQSTFDFEQIQPTNPDGLFVQTG